jgi:hypothetical protein
VDFERADIEAPSTSCAHCRKALPDRYFVASGAMVCEPCARELEAGLPESGRIGRVLKALVFGTAFGLAGTFVYGLILAFSNYQLALLTILIGWLVGTGVRKGSIVGGLGYQIMGAVLTYILCMLAFVPQIVLELTRGADPFSTFGATIVAIPFSLIVPFTGGIGPIGFLILAFGIYQGFKIPVFVPLEITGPYDLRVPVPAEKTAETFFEGDAGDQLLEP